MDGRFCEPPRVSMKSEAWTTALTLRRSEASGDRATELEWAADALRGLANTFGSELECSTPQNNLENLVANLHSVRSELEQIVAEYEAIVAGGAAPVRNFKLDEEAECPSITTGTRAASPGSNSRKSLLGAEFDSDDADVEPARASLLRRRGACSAEVFGGWNECRAACEPVRFEKSRVHRQGLRNALEACPLFTHMDSVSLDTIVDAMPVIELEDGASIMRQGAEESSGYVILSGSAEVYNDDAGDGKGTFVRTMATGRFFGETAMMWATPRGRSVYARGPTVLAKLERKVYQGCVMRRERASREYRAECIRQVTIFETLDDEQVAKIAECCEERRFDTNEVVISQGEVGQELFIVLSGDCVTTILTGTCDVQEVRSHAAGDMFGELALLEEKPRSATVTAVAPSLLVCLTKERFERLLGPLKHLKKQHYLSDPRKSIADFYRPGDVRGPRGACQPSVDAPDAEAQDAEALGAEPQRRTCTDWFAVYRPTSRDAIAKMLNGVAVGKGLNVKGKSAKKNHLSGFVPFLQISDNAHKRDIEGSPPEARAKIFYRSKELRENAIAHLEPLSKAVLDPTGAGTENILKIDSYPGVYGIELPEALLVEAYIMRQDISFLIGWETGRQSEPAFMNMNLHAVRGDSVPEVVLCHIDELNPMNPHGLVIAYAEATVKPVVSDFDTFTVGSRGMPYEPLPPDQLELVKWSMQQTREILQNPGRSGWNSRWLTVLENTGVHPEVPTYGFGDRTSYRLAEAVVNATTSTGAVRHGAECFNFGFPQALDDSYLIVWDGFFVDDGTPWRYVSPGELHDFLRKRIDEGFVFPLNPVWPVRDAGWYDIFDRLCAHREGFEALQTWYPLDSGIIGLIESTHKEFPGGFTLEVLEFPEDGVEDGAASGDAFCCVKTDGNSREVADLTLYVVESNRLRLSRTKLKSTRCGVRDGRFDSSHYAAHGIVGIASSDI